MSTAEEKKLTGILSSISDGVYLLDSSGNFTVINPRGKEILASFCKLDQGPNYGNILKCPCEFSIFLNTLLTEGGVRTGKEIRNEEGVTLTLAVNSFVNNDMVCNVITAKDITEEKIIQKRALLSSKLASLGEMMAGIAHEINNPLQWMLSNIEMIENSSILESSKNEKRNMERIKNGTLRINAIVEHLLVFAKNDTTELEKAELNRLVEKSVDILKNQLRMANIKVALKLSPEPLTVKVNKHLFQQIIINLLQNSKDAILDSGQGSTVTISTTLSGEEAVVEVADDGPGITEEIIEKIFLPFFTTKPAGKGTGLGLCVSRRLIEGMGGIITVASTPGKGAAFSITLPALLTAEGEGRKSRYLMQDFSNLVDKSVLIVDDEEELLYTISEAITSNVLNIETASSGEEAIKKVEDRDYDFMLLDVKMPGMDGIETYKRITAVKPYLSERIIFITGDIENKTGEFLKATKSRHLTKPFAVRDLLCIMCKIADRINPAQRSLF